jgi:hypothetical protein
MIISRYMWVNQGVFCGIDLPSRRKEVFTFYGPIFARQQIMVILAAAPAMCVLMLLLMLAIFSRVYLAHSLALPQSARESASRKKTLLARACSAAELVKYLHKKDSPTHSPADIAHNKVEILMVCVTSNAAAFAPRALGKARKNDENFCTGNYYGFMARAASLSAGFAR